MPALPESLYPLDAGKRRLFDFFAGPLWCPNHYDALQINPSVGGASVLASHPTRQRLAGLAVCKDLAPPALDYFTCLVVVYAG
jgi:hypothetical protein